MHWYNISIYKTDIATLILFHNAVKLDGFFYYYKIVNVLI